MDIMFWTVKAGRSITPHDFSGGPSRMNSTRKVLVPGGSQEVSHLSHGQARRRLFVLHPQTRQGCHEFLMRITIRRVYVVISYIVSVQVRLV